MRKPSKLGITYASTIAVAIALTATARPAPAQAQALQPVVDVCSGITLPRSAVTEIIGAVNQPIVSRLENTVNGLTTITLVLAPLANIPDLNIDLTSILADAAAGDPISLQILDTDGNIITASDDCNVTADGFTLDNPAGLAIGGNQITGLGNGTAASAGTEDSIALGNAAATAATAPGAVAIGSGASVTAANSVALGTGSVAGRGAQAGYTSPGLAGTFTSAGEISVGAPGALRQITNVAPGSAATDAATVGQVQGALDAVSALDALAVQYTDAGHTAIALDGAGGTTISGVAPGTLAADSTEAVNGGQLFATNQAVAGNATAIAGLNTRVTTNTTAITNLDGRVTNNTTDIANLDTRVTTNTTAITNLDGRVTTNTTDIANLDTRVTTNTTAITNLDGRVTTNTTDIANLDTRVTTNTIAISNLDARVTDNSTAITDLDQRVTVNTTDIANLQAQVANVPVGYVSDADGMTPSATPTDTVGFIGASGGAVRVTKVADGTLAAGSTDAVNGSQLAATNTQVAANTAAGTANAAAIAQNRADIAQNGADIDDLQANAVQYDEASHGTVTFDGAGGTRLAGVAAGTVAAGSTDAVNGGQLAATNAQVAQNTSDIQTINNNLSGSTVVAVQYSNPGTPTVSNGGTITNDVTLVGANAAAPVALHNVAAGTAATDAVNVGQYRAGLSDTLASAQSYTDDRISALMDQTGGMIGQLDFDLGELRRDAMAGVAGAMAVAGLPQTLDSSKSMISGAVAHYRGETALAMGFSSVFNDGGAVVKVGGSLDSRGRSGVTAGAGFSF